MEHQGEVLDYEWSRRHLSMAETQRRRYQLHAFRRKIGDKTEVTGSWRCLLPLHDQGELPESINVAIANGGQSHASALIRCGSVWACPVCAPKVRSERAKDIAAAVEAWLGLGNQVWMVTATVPHSRGESLATVLDRVQGVWSDTWSGRAAKQLREDLGIVGQIRAMEITTGSNGWHPHIHGLVFTKALKFDPVTIIKRIQSRWEALGMGSQWQVGVSCDVRQIESHGIGQYLGKIEYQWGAGQELARQDLKHRGGLSPAGLLELASCGESIPFARWIEYERTVAGIDGKRRQAIVWSRGLRAAVVDWQQQCAAIGVQLHSVELGENEKSDQELAAAALDQRIALWEVPTDLYLRAYHRGLVGELYRCLLSPDLGDELGAKLIYRAAPYDPLEDDPVIPDIEDWVHRESFGTIPHVVPPGDPPNGATVDLFAHPTNMTTTLDQLPL